MGKLSCKPCSFPPAPKPKLESELPSDLENSLIERRVDLAKVTTIYIKLIRHGEVGVIENVEGFEPQFNSKSFFEPNAFD